MSEPGIGHGRSAARAISTAAGPAHSTDPETVAEQVACVAGEPAADSRHAPSVERLAAATPKPGKLHRYDQQPPRVLRQIEEGTSGELARPEPQKRVGERLAVGHPKARMPAVSPPSAVEPVVQVSIGRIEVHAVGPVVSPPVARRGSAMTIEEYIAKRRERS